MKQEREAISCNAKMDC